MGERVVLGVDPGSKATGWCVIKGTSVLAVGIIKIRDTLPAAEILRRLLPPLEIVVSKWKPDLTVVEGQQFKYGGKAAPEDIIKLANVAGGIAGQIMAFCSTKMIIPFPSDWKGQTPKEISQSRTYQHFGIMSSMGTSYSYPSGCKVACAIAGYAATNRGDWKEIGDAMGLARYGAEL